MLSVKYIKKKKSQGKEYFFLFKKIGRRCRKQKDRKAPRKIRFLYT